MLRMGFGFWNWRDECFFQQLGKIEEMKKVLYMSMKIEHSEDEHEKRNRPGNLEVQIIVLEIRVLADNFLKITVMK